MVNRPASRRRKSFKLKLASDGAGIGNIPPVILKEFTDITLENKSTLFDLCNYTLNNQIPGKSVVGIIIMFAKNMIKTVSINPNPGIARFLVLFGRAHGRYVRKELMLPDQDLGLNCCIVMDNCLLPLLCQGWDSCR